MNLPRNGRVVIIDNDPSEALPLIKSLSKKSIPVTHFDGSPEDLPDIPLSDVRVVFLDINLEDYSGHVEDKTKASNAANVVQKIIGEDKFPYILLVWAKHDEEPILKQLELNLKFNPPLYLGTLNKTECKFEGYNLDFISGKISDTLNHVGFFHVLTLWENLVHQSSGEIIKSMSNTSNGGESDWNRDLESLFYSLAKANLGQNIEQVKEKSLELIKNSLVPFNAAFIDTLESNTTFIKELDCLNGFIFTERSLDDANMAKINSKLLLSKEGNFDIVHPGNLYNIDNPQDFSIDLMGFFDYKSEEAFKVFCSENNLDEKIQYVLLEVSTSCDHAQAKWKVNRFLPGLLIMSNANSSIYKKLLRSADYIYVSPILDINDKLCHLVFDMRYFSALPFEGIAKYSPLLRVKHEMVVDIQHKLSHHICRPGIVSLNSK